MAEVMLGVGVLGVGHEGGEEGVGVKDVDTHGGIDHLWHEGGADLGFFRFLFEAGDLAVGSDFHDAELRDLMGVDGERGEGDVGPSVDVLLEHEGVVHFVDVVAGEDDDVFGLFGADGVDVLVDGVCGALVPGLGDPLHGRQDLNELAELLGYDRAPTFTNVPVERKGLVLGEDIDVAKLGVDAVGEGEVDNAVLAGEGNGWLGAVAGKGEKTLASSTGEENTKRISHVAASSKRPCSLLQRL